MSLQRHYSALLVLLYPGDMTAVKDQVLAAVLAARERIRNGEAKPRELRPRDEKPPTNI
jgi:hypothetical protein